MSTTRREPQQTQQFSVRFPNQSSRQAGELVATLSNVLRDLDGSLELSREKSSPDTQDLGTILNIVLGSVPAATVAAGLAAFMRKKRVRVRIDTADRTVDVSGDSEDAARIIESVFTQRA